MKGKLRKIFVLALLVTVVTTATPFAVTAAPPSPQGFYYTVCPGDTLFSIARRFGSTVSVIAQANGIVNPAYIRSGQVLFIPKWPTPWYPTPYGFYYTVRWGDTLFSIARRFGANPWEIARANNLLYPNLIYAGQTLFIPSYIVYPPIVPIAVPTAIPQVAVCDPSVSITYPYVNSKLWGWVTINGTANIDNFWYYKLEFGCGEKPVEWSVIGELHYEPVLWGTLGCWDTSVLPEGVYQLRLVVVDKTGNYPQPCQLRVIIDR